MTRPAPRAGVGVRDVRAVLDVIGDVHEAEDPDDFRARLLAVLGQLVPADYVAHEAIATATGASEVVTSPPLPLAARRAWRRLAGRSPLVAHLRRTRSRHPVRLSDVVALRALRCLAIHRELLGPLGIDRQIAFTLAAGPDTLVAVTLSRGGRDFGERERRLLDLVRPGLLQASRHAAARRLAHTSLQALETGLEESDALVVVLDGRRRIAFAGRAALAALTVATGQRVTRGGRVPPTLARWLAAGGPAHGAVLALGPPEHPLFVRAQATAPPDGLEILHLEHGTRGVAALSLLALGLTPREAEVLQWMSRGEGTARIAAGLGISPRTVHKHVEHLLAKLGVADRTQAVAAAWAAAGAQASSETLRA